MTADVPSLEALGITRGQPVRFRRQAGARWHMGTAAGVEKDGSINVRDEKGASRAIPVDRIEVKVEGRGRSLRWEPLAEVAARIEQLRLL